MSSKELVVGTVVLRLTLAFGVEVVLDTWTFRDWISLTSKLLGLGLTITLSRPVTLTLSRPVTLNLSRPVTLTGSSTVTRIFLRGITGDFLAEVGNFRIPWYSRGLCGLLSSSLSSENNRMIQHYYSTRNTRRLSFKNEKNRHVNITFSSLEKNIKTFEAFVEAYLFYTTSGNQTPVNNLIPYTL